MLALRLLLKDKVGGKQHCLIPFVDSNLGFENIRKGCVIIKDCGTSVYVLFRFKENFM